MQLLKRTIKRTARVFAVATTASLLLGGLTACSDAGPKIVTIATHDSFLIPDELIKKFHEQTGYSLEGVKVGDAGELTNKLVLTKDAPIADLFFGIDNTFAGVATKNGIVDGEMTQIDYADVCFNYDKEWFAANGLMPPSSWQDLTLAPYEGLTVVENPATSSTGLAFMFSTIAKLGEPGWLAWWSAMKSNSIKIVDGWETAYYTEFSGAAGKGDYPIVLSYSSSPADEIGDDGQSRTAALTTNCFRQLEYAGVLKNAANPDGACAFIKFMLSQEFQSALPTSMYVYPVDKSVTLPTNWVKFAKPASTFVDVSELNFDKGRDKWLDQWRKLMSAG